LFPYRYHSESAHGGMENNIPTIRSGIKKEEPRYTSRRSHTLLKIKIDESINISSQKI
jgi:hypothetical protein